VLKAVKKFGMALGFSTLILKDNNKIVIEALKNNGCAIKYAS
jgi:hypothetical protein